MSAHNEAHFTPEAFSTREQCLQYLCDLKWGDGFTCRECGHTTAIKGKTWYYRKCQSCKKDESCISHTLFHNLRFPITTAFALVHQLCSARKGMSCCQISKKYEVSVVTAWFFRAKVQMLMLGPGSHSFEQYMSKSIKSKKSGSGRTLKLQVDCSSEGEKKTTISKIITNVIGTKKRKWGKERWSAMRGKNYKPRKSKKCLEIDIYFRNKDGDYKTQMFILNMKNWIAGVHHCVSMAYLERYMGEFVYRYDRREWSVEESMLELLGRRLNLSWRQCCWAKGKDL